MSFIVFPLSFNLLFSQSVQNNCQLHVGPAPLVLQNAHFSLLDTSLGFRTQIFAQYLRPAKVRAAKGTVLSSNIMVSVHCTGL